MTDGPPSTLLLSVVLSVFTYFHLQVCSRCTYPQLRWIPSTVKESLCHLTISWTRPGSLCLGTYTSKYLLLTLLVFLTVCLCVFVSFPPASASYILLQFAQYGNILRHKVRDAHSPVCDVEGPTFLDYYFF